MKKTSAHNKRARITFLSFSMLLMVFCAAGYAQSSLLPTSNSNTSAAATPTPESTPIPIADINIQSEEAKKRLETIANGLGKTASIGVIETELPDLRKEIDRETVVTSRLLSARPSLETLRVAEQSWQAYAEKPPAWNRDLKIRLTTLDKQLKELGELKEIWEKTRNSFKPASPEPEDGSNSESADPVKVPAEIDQMAGSVLALIEQTRKKVEERRVYLLTLQSRIAKEENRISETLQSIADFREEALTNLLVRDSPAIWNAQTQTDSASAIFAEASDTYVSQFRDLSEYASRNRDQFIFHGLLFLLLTGVLFWARKQMRPLVASEPELRQSFAAFEMPVVGALILAILLSGWFYPQAPRMLTSILGAAALVPGIIYLRRILEKQMFPVLNALVIFYFLDLVKQVTATLPLLSRLVFIVEMVGVIVFLFWYFRAVRKLPKDINTGHQSVFILIRKVAPFLLVVFLIALAANVFGYVSFSNVIGNSILASAYTALILYTAVQIVKSLVIFAFRVRPLSTLGMVANHRETMIEKVFWAVKWAGVVIWAIISLNFFSLRQSVFGFLEEWLSAELVVGSIAISLSDVLIFGFTVWLAFALSRLIRFVLKEDVYPRVDISGGVTYAVSTVLHYVILVVGFVVAVAALGIDMTKFTILAGALGVGLGFGLQNIVNNFVSGLILLFERPVKVDDVIEINGQQGDLKRIGLRASVLRTLDGSEIIVPNGQLISEQVTNWTFSDPMRRIEVNVGVAYGTDPRKVIELLTAVVAQNTDILKEPPARTIFVGFGESSLDFQLRAWTNVADRWMVVKSDLNLAINDVLNENNIEIPFPQRDLHLRSVDGKAAGKLRGKDPRAGNRESDRG